MSPQALKQRLFEAVRTLLLACAAQHPLVVAIEDLHWVDNATEEWLTFWLDQIAASRILLLLTYRPDFASTWSRKSYHSVITVTRLAQDDSYRLLTALLGTTLIHDDLATWVLDKAEGVPFFLEELVRGLTMNANMGARTWLAHTQHDYATMLLARNQPGDAEQAVGLLQDALTTARNLGMRALEDRIAARTNPETLSLSPPPLMDLDDLSPREIDVLRFLASGKSNREIADALFISRNTVSTHVCNILTKIGCANRTEAATYAMRHGLSEA